MGIEIQNVMAVVMMDLVQLGRGHHLSESHATTGRSTCNEAKKVKILPPGRKNSLFSVWPNEVYDDKSSEEDEEHTFSLSTKQSSKNKPFFFNQSARNTSGGSKGLR